jgi:DNA-binding NarL/FixJ family response regulator
VRDTGRRRLVVFAIEGCAVLANTGGQRERASRLVAAAAVLRRELGTPADRDPRLIAASTSTAVQELWRLIASSPIDGPVWSTEVALREAAIAASATENSGKVADGAGRKGSVTSVGLTPREVDVLRLVVAGRTDGVIADTLFISRRTASKHVSAILTKLAARSRAEAAVRAVRDGLV